jgi:hypothetical protein
MEVWVNNRWRQMHEVEKVLVLKSESSMITFTAPSKGGLCEL